MGSNWTLVTGASEGLGREFADIAAKSRRNVIIAARQADKLNALADDLRARHGVEVVVIPVDLSTPKGPVQLWAKASKDRRIEVLVNNAGLGRNGAFADPNGWDREAASIQVNMAALTYLMKQAIAHMQEAGGGKILNVASTAGFMPGPNMAVYHATKAYVLSLSEAVAHELKGSPVTITALCPGATDTNFFASDDAEGATLLTKMKMPTARSVAEAGWQAAIVGQRVKVTGASNVIFSQLPRILPRALTARIAGMFLERRG